MYKLKNTLRNKDWKYDFCKNKFFKNAILRHIYK
jgi:hypothetical protein